VTSIGSEANGTLTWFFAADGPADVYLLAGATSAANRSAAPPLTPGSRCWLKRPGSGGGISCAQGSWRCHPRCHV